MNRPPVDIFQLFRGELRANEPLAVHTSLRVGGPADWFAVPADRDDLLGLLGGLEASGIPCLVIGGGYNLLVRDGGFRGVVISLERLATVERLSGDRVRVEAGVTNQQLARFCRDERLTGLEFLAMIPGTVGGAIKMNAGAYGSGILERTASLTLLRDGNIAEYRMEELDYGYRHLRLQSGDIVLAAIFNLDEREAHHTEEEIRKDLDLRRSKHNVGFPSAGSFFKNPAGQAAWRLIDAAGMRGRRVGGAQVSEVHSNFLVNTGGATTQDFLGLARLVKDAVFSTSGVTLEEEVRIVGEE